MVTGTVTAEPILTVRGLHKTYPSGGKQLHVLRGVDLQVYPGKVVAVLGASGSGKTTLLQLIGALDRPDSGSILYHDKDIGEAGEEARAGLRSSFVGFVFQYHHLLQEFSAVENVQIPLLIAGAEPGKARQRATQLLEMVGLGERLEHDPSRLSGGEQQRVALARALANDPALVLADEPTGNLDRPTGEALYGLLYSLAREGNQSWIVATHNEYLARLADIRLRLKDGVLYPATSPESDAGLSSPTIGAES
ncbi:MAG: ABC transporter ATP-binding protein [Candidatus Eisenbacteria sp.]|nr:ABC transporter ATP-binding protein [Candidatus Eisenbacteria bacterium]